VKTFLQLNTIFLSMVMEAIPFVLVGVIVSGLIQVFLPERWVTRMMPSNKLLSSILGCCAGMVFLACDCGVVPITRRLLKKGLPLNAGIAFLLTAPILNPVVLFSTYIAFGNSWKMVWIRAGLAFAVAFVVSIAVAYLFPELPMRLAMQQAAAAIETNAHAEQPVSRPLLPQIYHVFLHAVDEFFSVGKYLVFGAFLAACMQTYVPTSSLMHLGSNPAMSALVMIGLAFIMSVCSEADAFIASSFRSTFPIGSLSAFLVFGPMIDIKNTMMLFGTFRSKFVFTLIALVAGLTFLGSLVVGRWIV
jgi:uncharacterized membrane protein YraQ (UPF0718 family)